MYKRTGLFPLLFLSSLAWAYNPPSDTAGPLTVRMQRPAQGAYGAGGFVELSTPGAPFVIPVMLENAGSEPLSGKLHLAVTDAWRIEPPDTIDFHVKPHGDAQYEFRVSFGSPTYNAHYPLHAYADFDYGGKHLTAHPVLILETNIPDLPRPRLPVEFQPVNVPKGSTLGLWRLPVRRESAESVSTGAEAGTTPRDRWESAPVFRYGPLARPGESREGIAITLGKRPPSMRETIDRATVEYPLVLPDAQPILLEFASAGDATFRVSAGDTTAFERRSDSSTWTKSTVDLTRYRGTTVRLRLEARDGSGEALWAEPTIIAGPAPAVAAFPPPQSASSIPLGNAAGCDVRLYSGSRGMLDAPIGFFCGSRQIFFRGFRARVTGDSLEDARASTELLETRVEPAAGRHRVRHRFRNWAGSFDLLAELWVERDALRSRFWLESAPAQKPWFAVTLEAVSAGPWNESVERVFAGPGNVIVRPKTFRLDFGGHSLATSFAGFEFANGISLVQNSEAIPDYLDVDPATRIATLVTPHAQVLSFFPAESVWDGVKRIREQDTRRPSPGVAKLAGRFTFDLWSGHYAESARALERAVRYGLKDSLVVWHNWQRWGYDYRLPDIYPPNPVYGTLEEFQQLAETCRRNGVLFAPHDNYIDFYPDFEGFSYRDIVFRQNGQPYRAWFNYGREAQSYRARPDRLRPFVDRNVDLMKKGFAPTAYFIDVWSSMGPYDFWTGEGAFIARNVTQRVWGETFARIRERLGGDAPQLSEAGHDKLIGWLDGADAQQLRIDPRGPSFTWKIECADSERIPWIDLAWHDRFILHGAGYPGRYEGGLDSKTHGIYSDDYMSTEILSGRPTMVEDAFSRDVVRKYWLLAGVAAALAGQRIESVEFAAGDIHRQHVKWSNGGEVWVNRGSQNWNVNGHVLPQYGFYARIGTSETAIEVIDGNTVESSRTPDHIYVNGRGTDTDFGTVRTAGAVRLTLHPESIEVTPAPDSESFPVRVPWTKLRPNAPFPTRAEPAAKIRREGDSLSLECEKGTFGYRLIR